MLHYLAQDASLLVTSNFGLHITQYGYLANMALNMKT